VTLPLLLFHVPLPDPSDKVTVASVQTVEEPDMLPAFGNGFTVVE
jgi:hypothetical protein